jgi:hypothetical protein
MRRVMGAVAAAAAATFAATVAMAPAFAAARPADHATLARTAAHGKTHSRARRTLADVITSDFGDGKYVTVVRCTGSGSTPPPVRLARLDDPLTVRGARPTAAVVKLLAKPKAYKTVYTCTVIVEQKVPTATKKPHLLAKKSCELGTSRGGGGRSRSCHPVVILNTGFGGEAGPVASHHPVG